MAERVDPRIVPLSIHDERSDAFGEVMRRALAEPDFKALLFERIDDVDARVLPFLIRSFNVQHFIEPGMTDAIIRRIIKGSFELHAQKGFIHGVRTGLAMLGISVASWSQWFQQHPAGAPGTHVATLSVGEQVFVDEGRAITGRLQRAIVRNVSRMQRKSQHIALRISTAGVAGGIGDMESVAPVHVGASVITRLRVSPSTAPTTSLSARPPLFVGAGIFTRLRIAPRIA